MGQVKSRQNESTKSTKSKQKMKVEHACLIDMLTDDALLKIFSYLTLYDKGQVAR